MQTDTPESLLEAVGVDWRADDTYWYLKCDTCGNAASRGCHCEPFDKKFSRHYTGPALGTPELDALLLVSGLVWLRKHNDWRFKHDFAGYITKLMPETDPLPWDDWLLWHCDRPGLTLARAIWDALGDGK